VNGNAPADFVPAWRHMKDLFAAEGATNVKFVWSPNADSVPNTAANGIAKYWPGESYVDLIAIDGYNFGGSTSTWRSFASVFSGAYSAVTALSATKPVFIAETACSTVGGDKAAWIAEMYRVLPSRFPRISGVTWFNTLKERDWRVESSAASLAAYKVGLSAWRVAQAPVPATGTATSLTALTSVTSVRLGNTAVLSGAATPFGTVGTNMVVYVMKPGKTYWSYSSRRTIFSLRGAAAWWYRYLFVSGLPRGTYRFKGCYPGSTGLLASSSSQVVSIALR